MVYNKLFFHVRVPYPLHQMTYLRKALIYNYHPEKSTKSSTKHCYSKKLFTKCFTKYCPKLCIQSLNNACAPTEMK